MATLKDPTPDNREAFEAIADSFTSVAEGKWTYGWSVEDSNKAIILAAWDSIEVCFRDSRPDAYADLLSFGRPITRVHKNLTSLTPQ